MSVIRQVHAREVLDSRGRPTVEVEIRCEGARTGRAIVPSGASTGRYEALERRDRDPNRYGGLGVRLAVAAVRETLGPALVGRDANDQVGLDRWLCELDGTRDKSRLGANALLGCSLAISVAAAEASGRPLVERLAEIWQQVAGATAPFKPRNSGLAAELPLPRVLSSGTGSGTRYSVPAPAMPMPMVNMISGGLHAGGQIDFQDFLAIPVGAADYSQALEWIVRIYNRLGALLNERGYEGTLVGDEGGYGPRLTSLSLAVECLLTAIERAGLRPGEQVGIALDVASSHFYEAERYRLRTGGERVLTSEEMVDFLADWVARYPILSIEDGVAEDDWAGWQQLTDRLGDRVQLVGDDLFVTNTARLADGLQQGAANAVLIKVNQVGTLTETMQTIAMAQAAGYRTVISARSGETEDSFMSDLAVATGAGQIKIGSVARSERLAKYNQLLRLEEWLSLRK